MNPWPLSTQILLNCQGRSEYHFTLQQTLLIGLMDRDQKRELYCQLFVTVLRNARPDMEHIKECLDNYLGDSNVEMLLLGNLACLGLVGPLMARLQDTPPKILSNALTMAFKGAAMTSQLEILRVLIVFNSTHGGLRDRPMIGRAVDIAIQQGHLEAIQMLDATYGKSYNTSLFRSIPRDRADILHYMVSGLDPNRRDTRNKILQSLIQHELQRVPMQNPQLPFLKVCLEGLIRPEFSDMLGYLKTSFLFPQLHVSFALIKAILDKTSVGVSEMKKFAIEYKPELAELWDINIGIYYPS